MTGDIQPEQQSAIGQMVAAQFAAISQSANETVEALSSVVGVGKELEHLGEVSETVAAALDHLPDHAKYMQRLDLATRAVIASMGQMQQRQDQTARDAPQQPQQPQKTTDPIRVVEEVVRKLAGKDNLANIADVRDNLSQQGMDRGEQDRLIRELRATQVLSASGYEGRHGISQREQDAAIPEGQARLGYLSFRDPQRLEEPKQPKASPVPPSPIGPAFAPQTERVPLPVIEPKAAETPSPVGQAFAPQTERVPLPVIEPQAPATRLEQSPLPSARRSARIDLPDETVPQTRLDTDDGTRASARRSAQIVIPAPTTQLLTQLPPPVQLPSPLPTPAPQTRLAPTTTLVPYSGPSPFPQPNVQPGLPVPGQPMLPPPQRPTGTAAGGAPNPNNPLAQIELYFGSLIRTVSDVKDMFEGMLGSRKRLEREERGLFTRLSDVNRGMQGLAGHLIEIPRSMGGLARQSLQAGAPTALSTLQKSWDLVLGQLAFSFLPAIVWATKRLQDLAESLGRFSKGAEQWHDKITGKEDTATRLGMETGRLWHGGRAGLEGIGNLFGEGGIGKGFRDYADRQVGITPLKRADMEHGDRLDDWLGRASKAKSSSLGEILEGTHGDELKQYFDGLKQKGDKAEMQTPFRQLPERMKQLIEASGLKGKFEEFDSALETNKKHGGLQLVRDKNGERWINPKTEGKDGKPLVGSDKGENKGKPYLTDNPPGYQAQYTQIADVRRQAQIAALNISPIDMEKMRIQRELGMEFIRQLMGELRPLANEFKPRGLPLGGGGGV